MESLRSLGGVLGATRVHERGAGGGQRDAEAFRRALERETETAGHDTGARPGKEEPVRTPLQQKAPASRKVEGATPRHVDVIA